MANSNSDKSDVRKLIWPVSIAIIIGLAQLGIKSASSVRSHNEDRILRDVLRADLHAGGKPRSSTVSSKAPTFADLLERTSKPSQSELIRVLRAGADPNEHIPFPKSDFDKIQRMVSTMAAAVGGPQSTPITRENFFNTPLTLAASLKSALFLNELLKRGADPNIKLHPLGTPPLQIAIGAQNLEMVQALLDHGADPDQISYIGNAVSAAVVAWKSKNETIMKELGRQLKKDDSVELISALEDIADKAFADKPNTVDARSFKILKLLLEKNAKVNVKNQNGLDPIMSSLMAHNYTAFLMLLPYYDDLDSLYYDIEGVRLPLSFIVAKIGKPELMRSVLRKGINTKVVLSSGDKLVDWAETPEIKEMILQYSAESAQSATFASRVYRTSKLSCWSTVLSEGNVELKIPPSLEIQGGQYKELADAYNLKVLKAPRDAKQVVIQQAGLNTNSVVAKTHYVRLMYKCTKGSTGDHWKLDEKLVLSSDEIKEIDDSYREGVEKGMIIGQKQIHIPHRLLRWDPVEVVPFANGTALKMSYCRQLGTNQPVELVQYQIGDDDRMHFFTFSYRQSERDLWLTDWNKIKETIRFLR